MPRRNHDWRAIEKAYVEGSLGQRALAREFRVPYKTLQKQSVSRGWVEKRKAYRAGQRQRAQEQAATDLAELPEDCDQLPLRELVQLLQRLGARKLLEAVASGDQIITPSGIKRLVEIEGLLKQQGGGGTLIPMETEERPAAGDESASRGRLFRMVAGGKKGGSKAVKRKKKRPQRKPAGKSGGRKKAAGSSGD